MGVGILSRVSRRTSMTCPFLMSRGPISRRSGTPRISHSAYFQPGECSSRSSSMTRMPRASSSCRIRCACGSTVSRQSPRGIGTMTTWCGATRGGRISPLSSPWVMMTPPMRRVVIPQDVCHPYCTVLSRPWNVMSNTLAKFCPRLWDVPACRARPSPISASIE